MATHYRLREDLKTALLGGDKERAGVLRFLLAEIHNKEKEKQAGEQSLSEEEAISVLQKEMKKRKEAVELFKKGGRDDLIKKEEAEIAVIESYLPKQLTPAEIKAVIDKIFESGSKDFNSLMREAMKELKGRADGRVVSELVKEKLK